ncbi:cytochrome b N-terminal domain-containing protein, partial [Patescibacteria group bacterium]|nr:cytochrome b N-terminal domain-containing protein [Patescibacteria group bacterium]
MAENQENQGTMALLKKIMIEDVPSYANKIYYSLGFLSATCFILLVLSGIVLVAGGPAWWLTNPWGIYFRSVHLWSTQAFVLFIFLHLLIVFLTYAYRKPRQLTWVLGGLMLFLVLMEAEFGYILRGDFSSQWRSLQASDLYNGSGLGTVVNNLNYTQIYGIHIAILPLALILLLGFHYFLVRMRGIAKPHTEKIQVHTVKAKHALLFTRGIVLTVVILLLATVFKSPLIEPVTIQYVASHDPELMAQTLASELDHSSDTATYSDNIDPYRYDTRAVYIAAPYQQYIQSQKGALNQWNVFQREPSDLQAKQVAAANDYFTNNGSLTLNPVNGNPLVPVISSLVYMAQSGLYEDSLRAQNSNGLNPSYAIRFLSDTGVLDDQAQSLGITTEQYGMIREESGHIPPGAWWLLPVGWMDHTFL